MVKQQKVYCIVTPTDWALPFTASWTATECRVRFGTELQKSWDVLYKDGYRCRAFALTPLKETPNAN